MDRLTSKATDYKKVPMEKNGAEQPKGRLVARKAPKSNEGATKTGKPQRTGPHRAVRKELDTREGT